MSDNHKTAEINKTGAPTEQQDRDSAGASFRVWLWISIFAAFLVVHLPKDKIVAITEGAVSYAFSSGHMMKAIFGNESAASWTIQNAAVRLKHIVFLVSLIFLFCPVAGSLRRAGILWDPEKFKRRLILTGAVFLCLAFLVLPFRLKSAGYHYAMMSVSPFEATTNWYYRRLLMPAIAHFLGFEGQIFYSLFSMAITFALIFLGAAYLEHEGIKINFLRLMSISTSGFIIFNYMIVGFADPLIFIFFLLALFVLDSYESRLSVVALSLIAHEGSVFILVPMILFLFPKKHMLKYLAVIAVYSGLYFLSYRLDVATMVKSQFVTGNRIGIDWVIAYPWRAIGGWFLSYKLLWLVILFALYKMVKAGELTKAMAVASFSIGAPLIINILAVDVYRHVSEGFCGLLISCSYLVKSGYGNRFIDKAVIALNLAVPSIYVGTNNGFRFVPGLYTWLCQTIGLQSWLAKL